MQSNKQSDTQTAEKFLTIYFIWKVLKSYILPQWQNAPSWQIATD